MVTFRPERSPDFAVDDYLIEYDEAAPKLHVDADKDKVLNSVQSQLILNRDLHLLSETVPQRSDVTVRSRHIPGSSTVEATSDLGTETIIAFAVADVERNPGVTIKPLTDNIDSKEPKLEHLRERAESDMLDWLANTGRKVRLGYSDAHVLDQIQPTFLDYNKLTINTLSDVTDTYGAWVREAIAATDDTGDEHLWYHSAEGNLIGLLSGSQSQVKTPPEQEGSMFMSMHTHPTYLSLAIPSPNDLTSSVRHLMDDGTTMIACAGDLLAKYDTVPAIAMQTTSLDKDTDAHLEEMYTRLKEWALEQLLTRKQRIEESQNATDEMYHKLMEFMETVQRGDALEQVMETLRDLADRNVRLQFQANYINAPGFIQ